MLVQLAAQFRSINVFNVLIIILKFSIIKNSKIIVKFAQCREVGGLSCV